MKREPCRCAACAGTNQKRLVHCPGCNWRNPARAAPAKELLAKFSPRAARLAYHRDGCAVCVECREEFSRDPGWCPLYVLSLAALPVAQQPRVTLRQGFLDQLGAALGAVLKRRDFPEETEIYWARLLTWLRREWTAFRWNRNR